VAVFKNRQPVTEAKFINKSSLFILMLIVIRLLKLKLNNEQKVEHIFVAAIMPNRMLNRTLVPRETLSRKPFVI